MDGLTDLYVTQPFWIWLAVGVILLAIEAAFSTEWLLWPAVAAGVVAVLAALGLRAGLPIEIAIFAALTMIGTVFAKRLVKRVNPSDSPDINDRNHRLVGQRAQVTQPFVDGRGRVFVSGAEWPADIDGEAPAIGQSVTVEAVAGPRLRVRTA